MTLLLELWVKSIPLVSKRLARWREKDGEGDKATETQQRGRGRKKRVGEETRYRTRVQLKTMFFIKSLLCSRPLYSFPFWKPDFKKGTGR